MRKIVKFEKEIFECRECPFFEKTQDHGSIIWWCNHANDIIPYQEPIPKWCPFDDIKED